MVGERFRTSRLCFRTGLGIDLFVVAVLFFAFLPSFPLSAVPCFALCLHRSALDLWTLLSHYIFRSGANRLSDLGSQAPAATTIPP